MTDRTRLDNLFEVTYGTKLDLKQMRQTTVEDIEGICFVSRSSQNLGVSAYVKPYEDIAPLKPGLISVALGGSVLSAFVRDRPFYTAQNVAVLAPKQPLTFTEKLFYCLCLERNRFRYSTFGREANRTLGKIQVPRRIPDSMESLTLELSTPDAEPILDACRPLNTCEWKEFRLADLFHITGTETTALAKLKKYGSGKFPYVTTRSSNNGVAGFYAFSTEPGQVLVVDSAVLGYCTFQRDDFAASDHVEKLLPKFQMNQYHGIFLSTVINHNQYRYSYGRKASQTRLRNSWIKLPADVGGEPDWKYMEEFVQSLQFSRSL